MNRLNFMKLSIPARSANEGFSRAAVAAFAALADPTVEELADVKTAVSEAVTNCIVHAYGEADGMICIDASLYEGGALKIRIEDKGCGIPDVEKARRPFFTTMEDEDRSGMGFTVMESFMDRVDVISQVNSGTIVRMKKRLAPACSLAREA